MNLTDAKSYLAHHLFYVALIVVLLFFGHTWLQEHDARIAAENVVKVNEAEVKNLQSQIDTLKQITAQKVVVIQKESAAIKTAPQAAPVIQAFDSALNARLLPAFPQDVQVAAVPLAHDIEQCRIDRVSLSACTEELQKTEAIRDDKDREIKALKAKPKFWKRVTNSLKTGGVFIVIFEAAKIALTHQI